MAKRAAARKTSGSRKKSASRAGAGTRSHQGRSAKVVQMDLFQQARDADGAALDAVAVASPSAGSDGPAAASGTSGSRSGAKRKGSSKSAPKKAGRRRTARKESAAAAPSKPAAPARGGARLPRPPKRESAETMAARQRDISVSEFFTKNRHLLGFDKPQKALLTATKEAVDNSLDACEEAGILPDLEVIVQELQEDRFKLTVTDNGPGILKNQIPRIFGKLLYGSKFHSLKQSRGQQGIGISAAGMYSQLTTGKPVEIISRTNKRRPAHRFLITIDTRKNLPQILKDEVVEWEHDHGTRVSMELEGVYKKGRRSLDDYISQTALANPHAAFLYKTPKGEEFRYTRISQEMPKEPLPIKPHPYGVELGVLMRMLKETRGRSVAGALQSDFSRVSAKVAEEICAVAGLKAAARPRNVSPADAERLFRAIPKVKIMAPPTNCLSPIGAGLIEGGLKQAMEADFFASVTRSPAVYRGNPFQIEVGLAYGGDLPADELVDLWRYANRVPLQYQQSACAITRSVIGTDWRKYGLQQGRGALPTGPMVIFAHIASVWVPFTSESKEAVAAYPEIIKEIRLGMQECGRKLGAFLSRRRRLAEAERKKSYIEKYIPHIGIALREILGLSAREEAKVVSTLKDTLERSRKI